MPNQTMVSRTMAYCRNYFETEKLENDFSLSGGVLSPEISLSPGAWVAIADGPAAGVWQAGAQGSLTDAPDGCFTCLWLLEPPADFLRLCDEIGDWLEKHPRSACVQETFGSYRRTMAAGSGGCPVSWTELFAPELMRWRRLMTEVHAG